MFETIVALATPPLRSALSIIRMSGEDCFNIVNNFFSKEIKFTERNKIFFGNIVDDEIIDEVILLAYNKPFSYTGEECVEIICHGNPIIFNKIIEIAIKNGARLATGGEFTSRAFLNGKYNLIQAESIQDLINAETLESKKLSLLALKGESSKLILPIKTSLAEILSLIEVNINYPEYLDIEQANQRKITEVCRQNISYIDSLILNGKKGKIIKDGINIVIVGKPNVGKSSILNSLIGENKAIVTDIKGTTRDIVEGRFNLNGVMINLFDTAGIRDSEDIVEKKGIEKSIEKLKESDLVIAVFDSVNKDDEDKKILETITNYKHIIIYNKKDINDYSSILRKNEIAISAINNDIKILKDKIMETLGLQKSNYDNPSICNQREIALLEKTKQILNNVLLDISNNIPIDIINSSIQSAYLTILSLLGEDNDFDIADEIFSRFCVGK